MKALVFEDSMARTVATKGLATLNPRLSCWDHGKTGAAKVLFEFPPATAR